VCHAGSDSTISGPSSDDSISLAEDADRSLHLEFAGDLDGVRLSKTTSIALIVAQAALTLAFLVLLLWKLQQRLLWSWLQILAPLYIANGARVAAKFTELLRLRRIVSAFDNDPESERTAVLSFSVPQEAAVVFVPVALDFIDNAGECATTVLVALLLDGRLAARVTVVLFPLWIQVLCGSVIRCYSYRCVDSEADQRSRVLKQLSSSVKSLGYLAYKAIPAALISMRLDGIIHARWVVIFLPWWLVTIGLGIGSCCLCWFASALDPLRQNDTLEPAIRQHFARSWSFMVKSMVAYLLIIDALAILFLLRLARYLDSNSRGNYVPLLFPLFFLYVVTLLLSPPLFIANAKIDEFRRDTELAQLQLDEAAEDQTVERRRARARRARRARRPIMKLASKNLLLLRSSSSVFKRTKEIKASSSTTGHLEHGHSNGGIELESNKLCYVCMTSGANGVLMECGHGGLCYQCGLELARKGQQCPLCRSVIEEVVHIDSMTPDFGIARSSTQVKVKHRNKAEAEVTATSTSADDGLSPFQFPSPGDHLRRNGSAV
jgi:hypothetical protein